MFSVSNIIKQTLLVLLWVVPWNKLKRVVFIRSSSHDHIEFIYLTNLTSLLLLLININNAAVIFSYLCLRKLLIHYNISWWVTFNTFIKKAVCLIKLGARAAVLCRNLLMIIYSLLLYGRVLYILVLLMML
jgi:hypothetical protein